MAVETAAVGVAYAAVAVPSGCRTLAYSAGCVVAVAIGRIVAAETAAAAAVGVACAAAAVPSGCRTFAYSAAYAVAVGRIVAVETAAVAAVGVACAVAASALRSSRGRSAWAGCFPQTGCQRAAVAGRRLVAAAGGGHRTGSLAAGPAVVREGCRRTQCWRQRGSSAAAGSSSAAGLCLH